MLIMHLSSNLVKGNALSRHKLGSNPNRCTRKKSFGEQHKPHSQKMIKTTSVNIIASITQWLEFLISNQDVAGSSPAGCTIHEWQYKEFYEQQISRKHWRS